ncbi:Lrp/AsnC family transcriptional regulator [Amycolatopsis jejuensis]|uniref:Lrp/AsnC family transcriptional regulator n=1 Tax=Amycolatopsis jejuensis TaxID=330084 RepID=UPI001B80A092|nr:Lrp/AsnC family transcriptional regulator [Amycolatopsis jejuensis]
MNEPVGTERLVLDRLDVELVGVLARDARIGVGELAAALGIARNTVQSRLRRLAAEGLLRGYRPDIDLARAGADVMAFMAIELTQGHQRQVIKAMSAVPEVLEIHTTTGREDLLVRLATVSHAALQALIERLLAIPGVTRGTTSLALSTPLAYRTQPLLEKITENSGWGRSTPLPKTV